MLLLRQAEQQARVEEEHDRLSRIQSRIRLIEQETFMSQEVILKQLPKQWVASVRETIAIIPSVGQLYPKVFTGVGPGLVGQAPCLRACGTIPSIKRVRVSTARPGIFLKEPVKATGGVRVYELPARHRSQRDPRGFLSTSARRLTTLCCAGSADNGYQVTGPIRELYLQNSQPIRQDDESYVTEIQVPISQSSLIVDSCPLGAFQLRINGGARAAVKTDKLHRPSSALVSHD